MAKISVPPLLMPFEDIHRLQELLSTPVQSITNEQLEKLSTSTVSRLYINNSTSWISTSRGQPPSVNICVNIMILPVFLKEKPTILLAILTCHRPNLWNRNVSPVVLKEKPTIILAILPCHRPNLPNRNDSSFLRMRRRFTLHRRHENIVWLQLQWRLQLCNRSPSPRTPREDTTNLGGVVTLAEGQLKSGMMLFLVRKRLIQRGRGI